jgi:hypothetical protein
VPGLTSPTEEQQLKQIWSEVNVGANGFLDKNELSVVCEHIGMEGIDEDVSVARFINCTRVPPPSL